MKAVKLLAFFVFVLSVLAIRYSLIVKEAYAQIPGFKVPCDTEKDPEFHSDRPYQASPCGDSPKAVFCNNDYIIVEEVSTDFSLAKCHKSGNQYVCTVSKDIIETYVVDGVSAELPILGNTEDVKNSQKPDDSIDDATKLNEYVSWYLNGIQNKAEYGSEKSTDYELINLSGPVAKLLPSVIQDAQRVNTILQAVTNEPYTDTEGAAPGEEPETVDKPGSHNQIVVCTENGKPVECYGESERKEYRLKDWDDGTLSPFNTFFNWLGTDIWNEKYPPLPWQFKEDVLYQKAYNEWQGKNCAIIPVTNTLVCSDLFPYVPLANTTDKNAKQPVGGVGVRAPGQTVAEMRGYIVRLDPVLFYPHTKEVFDLTNVLKNTFKPQEGEGETEEATSSLPDFEDNGCEIVDVRSNAGEELFPSSKDGRENDLTVDVDIHVSQIACPAGPIDKWLQGRSECDKDCGPNDRDCVRCDKEPTCDSEVYVGVRTGPKIPYIEDIRKETVTSPDSIFRKIFPKVENGAPVNCIADIPGVSSITYKPASNTDLLRIETPGGNFEPENSKLYFPGLGTVYEYFLKGIQTALRPQGYGESLVSGQNCTNITCGELPEGLPKASGSCDLGGISPKVGNIPQSLKDIISAAAETYKVPPNLILGVMYGEGLFEEGRFSWTDQNVKNWATCQKVPNCSESGDDNFMGFFSNDWINIAPKIRDDLLELDPNREEPNQCNLLDAVYGLAWNLHDSADGGGGMPARCFGIDLKGSVPGSCDWSEDGQYASAIQAAENGYDPGCFTLENSCLLGGGKDALCPGNGDTCETKDNRYKDPSHFACVWDVAHGN
ncbi:MAG: hypothetical protein UX13_C0016G0012 [Candidatus Woesebacteria bacterium GW2011_GWB1_45_5]|uniref:Transglycosylase SLT domain-containing protein n=1 Tax=Candidatus Woesebacteria bacterium GW2011_GWB1_45_5 TaxID=1618581 RepID=A0A0G1QNP2_9BACT|nr:MAG: hypothetical protein UX13_C0016G0012 [Candidatus Woesebacteria bacterium GW2011_GWB1_45_5]